LESRRFSASAINYKPVDYSAKTLRFLFLQAAAALHDGKIATYCGL
jgi:hypothetical protein